MTKLAKGSRNLIILGVVATLIAITTTTISLVIYHTSGDIYIDRSRPGFLPDETETAENDSTSDSDFVFSESGELTVTDLYTYEKNLRSELDAIDDYEAPFSESALSDETLGLPGNEE